MIKDQTTN